MSKVDKKVKVKKEYIKDLEEKAHVLENLLSYIEDNYLGLLMKKHEKEKNISLSEAKKKLK